MRLDQPVQLQLVCRPRTTALGDFECAPELASDYLGSKVESELELDATANNGPQDDDWPPDKRDGNEQSPGDTNARQHGAEGATPMRGASLVSRSITLEQRRVGTDEPIELTCPISLVDELDVSLTRVKWLFQFQRAETRGEQHKLKLIWRSDNEEDQRQRGGADQTQGQSDDGDRDKQQRQMIMMKLDRAGRANELHAGNGDDRHRARQRSAPSGHGDKFAIIDYVTRANSSGRAAHWEDAAGRGQVADNGRNHGTKTLIRLVQLIAHPKWTSARNRQIWFLCRVSNSAGQLDVWQPIEVEESDGASQRSASAGPAARGSRYEMPLDRLALVGQRTEELLKESGGGAPPQKPPGTSNDRGGSGSLVAPSERAAAELEREFANLQMDRGHGQIGRPLFLPLSVTPRHLLAGPWSTRNQSRSDGGPPERDQMAVAPMDSLERSLVAVASDVNQLARPTKLRQASQPNVSLANGPNEQEAPASVGRNRGRGVGLKKASLKPSLDAELANDEDDSEPLSRSHVLGEDVGQGPDQGPDLQESALSLIGRFTSEQRALIGDWKRVGSPENRDDGSRDGAERNGPEARQAELELRARQSSLSQLLAEAWQRRDQSPSGRLRELYQIFSIKLGEVRRSSALATNLPHLLAGLLAGCLLTLAILFRLNARRLDKGPPVHDKTDASPDGRPGRGGGGRPLPDVKLRRKIAAKVMKCKSNSALEIDGHRIKSNAGAETAVERVDYACGTTAALDQEGEFCDELHSYYSNNNEPASPSPQTLSQVSCHAGEQLHHSGPDCTATVHSAAAAVSADGRRPAASGSTGSTTTTTNGSQRALLPVWPVSSTQGCRPTFDYATGRRNPSQVATVFGSLSRGLGGQMMQKSCTMQNFALQDNYERLMGANGGARRDVVGCSPSTATDSELMSESNNSATNPQLDNSSVGCWPPQSDDKRARSSTLQSGRRFAGDQRGQVPAPAVTGNKRTVTWRMSNECVGGSNQQALELAADQLEKCQMMSLNKFGRASTCQAGRTSAESGWAAEFIGLASREQQHLAPQQGVQQRGCCCSAAPESGSLFAMTNDHGLVGQSSGQTNATNTGQSQQANFLSADSTGRDDKLEFLNNGNEICLLPACLCVGSGELATSRELNNESELVLDSDESYHLYGMFSGRLSEDQSCCQNGASSTRDTATGASSRRGAVQSSQQHLRADSLSVVSPNATISTSSASTGQRTRPAQRQPKQPRRSLRADAGPPSAPAFSRLDDALALLQDSLSQCDSSQRQLDSKTKEIYR